MSAATAALLVVLIQFTTLGNQASEKAAPDFSAKELRLIRQFQLGSTPSDPTNAVADNPAAAQFGQFLFFDTRFSANGAVSCATCHQPEKGFADGIPLARGLEEVSRHSQSLWQVAYQRWFFWDGRADSLWAQALEPFEDAREMGFNRLALVHAVAADPDLKMAYEAIFEPLPNLNQDQAFPANARPVPNQPSHPHHQAWLAMRPENQQAINQIFANIGKAIAAYQRQLVANQSPFDLFAQTLAKGENPLNTAYPPNAMRGLKLFVGKAGCRLCHSGPNFSDGEFHNNGVPPRTGKVPKDAGRWEGIAKLQANPFNAASRYSDAPQGDKASVIHSLVRNPDQWGQFRTPSLRQVALSPPYMHQGQLPDLEAVIDFYADLDSAIFAGHHREPLLQPLDLNPSERRDLVAFLRSLTSPPPNQQLLTKPLSPLITRP